MSEVSRDHAQTAGSALGWLLGRFSPSKLACEVAVSLVDRPDEWDTADHYQWRHASGVRLWVANEDYGMGVAVGDVRPNDGHLSTRDRRHIWRAVRQHRNRALEVRLAALKATFSSAEPAERESSRDALPPPPSKAMREER